MLEPIPYGVYISGPMAEVPEYNYPLFNNVAKTIATTQSPHPHNGLLPTGQKYVVHPINPAQNFNGVTDLSREVYLELALRQVDMAQAICLLPFWYDSPGARLELARALHLGLDVWLWVEHKTYFFQMLTHEEAQGILLDTAQPVSEFPPILGPEYDLEPGEKLLMHAEKIEEEAARLVRNGARQGTYGHPRGDFDTIARIWSAILSKANGFEVMVDAERVALCMSGLKLSRLARDPHHRDSKVDNIGYMICLDRLDEPVDDIEVINEIRERRGQLPWYLAGEAA